MGYKIEKLTVVGPGTKVLPTVNASDQLNEQTSRINLEHTQPIKPR